MKRILVTNDDGIDSPGLHALATGLTGLGQVVVLAPSSEYSGAGAAIGHLGAGIAPVYPADRPELDGVAAHHLDGPPALAVLLAVQGLLGPPPDLVVAGINPGWNVGLAVLFSGTIGAAVTARQLGVPAIAVSQPTGGLQRWETAAGVAFGIAADLDGSPVALNVNVPNVPAGELRGTRTTTLSGRIPYRLENARLGPPDEEGGRPVLFDRTQRFSADDDADTVAVEAGFVSITPLRPTAAG